jgi:predicted dehydrogenase
VIRVGLVGLGFMGWIHWLTHKKRIGVRVVAVCEQNPRRLEGDLRGIQGNFGPPGERIDLSRVATYADFDDLLADDKIDLVDITLPTSLHAEMAIAALKAGKHVFCEKPMALRLDDCAKMVAAAKKAKRLLMIGHVLPFFPEYNWARTIIRSGIYGRLLGGSFRRVISEPTWLRNFWSADHIGGPMLDLHIHDAHFIRLLYGMPQEVTTIGRTRKGLPQFWHSQFRFADGNTVEATGGTIDQQGRPFVHGFEIHLEQATLAFEFAVLDGKGTYLCAPVVLDNDGKARRPRLGGGDPLDAFADEVREVSRCVRDGEPSEILGAELARDAMQICEQESLSLKRGKPVKFGNGSLSRSR